jgi:hypothetical protein
MIVMQSQEGLCRGSWWLLSFVLVTAWIATAQTPLITIDMPQGGRIVYGKVAGADTQGAAMTHVLRVMHDNCGDKPQIGRVFKMRGTDSVGLFFTVLNHPAGNVQVAGLIIAAGSAAHQAEAALVSDRADRFGSTINPMLTKLFSVWHPPAAVSTSAPATKSPVPGTASAAGEHSPVALLHTVSASDGSATIGIPDGWTLDPHSASGTMLVAGPHGEQVYLGMSRMGIDPTHPGNQMIPRLPGTLIYPFRGDMAREFSNMFQAWRRANGKPPAPLQVEETKPMQGAPNSHCVIADGQVDLDGSGMKKFNDNMCASDPGNTGGYTVTLSHMLVPNALAEQEHTTLNAILSSWKVNLQVVNQQAAVAVQQMNANTQAAIRRNQQTVANINQIGANATARYNATQAANDAQHAAWNQSQDNISRNGQGFSNYLLDQTVIRDVQDPNTHVTVWNQAAEAWKKAYPDRIEEVPTAQYINGQDY